MINHVQKDTKSEKNAKTISIGRGHADATSVMRSCQLPLNVKSVRSEVGSHSHWDPIRLITCRGGLASVDTHVWSQLRLQSGASDRERFTEQDKCDQCLCEMRQEGKGVFILRHTCSNTTTLLRLRQSHLSFTEITHTKIKSQSIERLQNEQFAY